MDRKKYVDILFNGYTVQWTEKSMWIYYSTDIQSNSNGQKKACGYILFNGFIKTHSDTTVQLLIGRTVLFDRQTYGSTDISVLYIG